MPTPRQPVEQKDGRIITKDGNDLTDIYRDGANKVLELAQLHGVTSVILKQGSPSCGCGKIYDGTFSGTMIIGDGITTKLLKEHGIEVLTEDDL